MVWEIGARTRIICLLHLPSHNARFDIDLPRTRPCAVDTVRRPHLFVMLPAVTVDIFPISIFDGRLSMPICKCVFAMGLEELLLIIMLDLTYSLYMLENS